MFRTVLRELRGRPGYSVFLLAVTLSIYSVALSHSSRIVFNPTNGAFQNFNPLRRMATGQSPGSDFQPYLGLGLTRLLALCTGHNVTFASSLLACRIVCAQLFFLTTLLLGFLTRLPVWISGLFALWLMIIGLGGLAAQPGPGYLFLGQINILATPANSMLMARCAVTLLLAVALLSVPKRAHSLVLSTSCGALAGVALFWCNDYGPASAVALFAAAILDGAPALRQATWRALTFAAAAATAAVAAAAVLTNDYAESWLRYNLRGVAADQFWYFQGDKWLSLTDTPVGPVLLFSVLCMVVVGQRLMLESRRRDRALFVVLSTCFMAACVGSSGSLNRHYFVPCNLVTWYVAAGLAREYFLGLRRVRREVAWACMAFNIGCIIGAAVLVVEASPNFISAVQRGVSGATAGPTLPSRELGGNVAVAYDKMLAIGRDLQVPLQSSGTPPYLFSTYVSGLDVVAHGVHPTPYDYMIHALGPQARQEYVDALRVHKAAFATTLREDFTPWEAWLRRVNWDFYRALWANYRPVDRTFYNILWERQSGGIAASLGPVQCRVRRMYPHTSELILTYERPPASAEVRFVDVSVHYQTRWRPGRWAWGSLRHIETVDDRATARQQEIGAFFTTRDTFGVPPAVDASGMNWHFPVEMVPNSGARIRISTRPYTSELLVDRCDAVDFVGKKAVDEFPLRQLRAGFVNDTAYARGVRHDGLAFRVSDRTDLRDLEAGQTLRFANSGARQVTQIVGDEVHVDAAVDPQLDGYPNVIVVESESP